jgi:hypothetical protein
MSGNIQASSNNSPSYLKASSPEDLEMLMLQTNIRERKQYHFRDIQFSNGFWYCWFDKDQSGSIKIIKKQARA